MAQGYGDAGTARAQIEQAGNNLRSAGANGANAVLMMATDGASGEAKVVGNPP